MSDVFNRNTDTFGGAFAADMGFITFPQIRGLSNLAQGADIGLLIQRLAMTYQQQVTRLFEVGRSAIYYVGGRTSGDVGVDRVIGPRTISDSFYTTYGDMCRARTNTLNFTMQNGCGFDGSDNQQASAAGIGFVDYTAHFCVITTVGVNVQAANMIINESIRIMFSSLVYSTTTAAAAVAA